ncbi:AMP-binding protein [Streptomyces sp. NBC_00237]|nr:AMP-binding protein [Streptomyces sp. NBC_00237]
MSTGPAGEGPPVLRLAPDPTLDLPRALARHAAQAPEAIALRRPGRHSNYLTTSYRELHDKVRLTATVLRQAGLTVGNRAVVMIRDPEEFLVHLYALMSIGAVPVLIDPGLPRTGVRTCLDEIAPHAFLADPLAHLARALRGWARSSKPVLVQTGARNRGPWPHIRGLRAAARTTDREGAPPGTAGDGPALIAFTSGSTGCPKGVLYTSHQLALQAQYVSTAFGISPGTPAVCAFLPFSLYLPALGAQTLVPAFDPRRPADADPKALLDTLTRFRAHSLFGSPALLRVAAQYCADHHIVLQHLRDVASFGAPLSTPLLNLLDTCVPPTTRVRSVYGATEALPVAMADRTCLRRSLDNPTSRPPGSLVGTPLPGVEVHILPEDLPPQPRWNPGLAQPPLHIGEITVGGSHVSRAYFARPQDTASAKIHDGQRILHRTGDLGWIDTQGQLWYSGRKAHTVHTPNGPLYTEQIEPSCNTLPGIVRTALVGIGPPGAQRAVLCIETTSHTPAATRAATACVTTHLTGVTGGDLVDHVLVHPGFPVDVRHNAKIERPVLAAWAASRLPVRAQQPHATAPSPYSGETP